MDGTIRRKLYEEHSELVHAARAWWGTATANDRELVENELRHQLNDPIKSVPARLALMGFISLAISEG